jgi:dipeptidyl aminopeptidase/acylaminoacyl peptidase
MLLRFTASLLAAITLAVAGSSSNSRLLNLDDLNQLHDVVSPQVSPDGKWVAYTVLTIDHDADKRLTHIWMSNWEGTQELQLTNGPESESSPRWSPDDEYLSFTSSRPGKTKGSQVWILPRLGGEARQLTHFDKYEISEHEWSPDSSKLLLVLREKEEPEPEETKPPANPKPPKPIVIDRYHFKQDIQGYLNRKRNHIYLFDIATEKLEPVTTGNFDETNAAWSPDGSKIGFVSNQDPDPDRSENTDVFVVDARPNATPRRLTTHLGPDSGPLAWSTDSRFIAYLEGSDPKYSAYGMNRLAIVSADGGSRKLLTQNLDRGVSVPAFSSDGRSLSFLVADDCSEYLATVPVEGGRVERLLSKPLIASSLSSKANHSALLIATDESPAAVFTFENGSLRQLSHQNDKVISQLKLGTVEGISFISADGTEIHGLVTKPPEFESGRKYPALLRIHGGPNGQDGHAFSFEHQLFAAHGYVVIAVNYRGSAGRGHLYGESIFADWGDKEVADLLAGVDHVVQMGVADSQRLGIGGWSYGGILTDYTIATDHRFKAAISGAGSANQISMYGLDQYIFQYDTEIGPPWKNQAAWIKLSYPFFHADRINTPTLFMGGDKDFNVPLAGGEQMYQALQTLHVPTELVIYPGQFHGFTRPSFIRDRYERYLAWYGKYLHPEDSKPVSASLAH